jgi:hypothetical protein
VPDPVSGLKPIHLTARLGNLNVLKALLEDERVFADSVDPRGKVPYEWERNLRIQRPRCCWCKPSSLIRSDMAHKPFVKLIII